VGKDGEPTPAIIQKSDGGFPYITTDLAAARHRSQELNIDEALYFVDARQTLHFKQLFHIALKAGFNREDQNFRHIPNGIILSKEGKPYKTRQGGAVKLAEVLKESILRAKSLVSDKNSALSEQEQIVIAEIVGIGAIKYAELSKNRNTDYVFDWEKMLSFEGNTAPYLQYAYTRIKGILNKSKRSNEKLSSDFALQDPYEIQLALKLAQFTEAVESVVEDYQPNLLCNYLFELSQFFMTFYENCPVNTAEERIKISRLNLCDLTGRVLKKGLELLGIEVLDRM
jgi:arginyl-tRNA synthetase